MSEEKADSRTSHLPGLRAHRKRRALTQVELSKISGVGRATIARLEAGGVAYRSTINKLSRALKVKPHELIK